MSEIKSNLSQQSEKVCFRARNTGISLPVMLKDVFFPEPVDLKLFLLHPFDFLGEHVPITPRGEMCSCYL